MTEKGDYTLKRSAAGCVTRPLVLSEPAGGRSAWKIWKYFPLSGYFALTLIQEKTLESKWGTYLSLDEIWKVNTLSISLSFTKENFHIVNGDSIRKNAHRCGPCKPGKRGTFWSSGCIRGSLKRKDQCPAMDVLRGWKIICVDLRGKLQVCIWPTYFREDVWSIPAHTAFYTDSDL